MHVFTGIDDGVEHNLVTNNINAETNAGSPRSYDYYDTIISKDECFLAGTPILMADGSEKPIEDIAVDDWVMAFDGLGALQPARVSELHRNTAEDIIRLSDGTGVTLEHPYLCVDGKFRPAHEVVEQKMLVLTADGKQATLEGAVEHYTSIPIYNFTVEGLHTYVAGGMRVHNKSIMQFYVKGSHIINEDLEDPLDQTLEMRLPDGTIRRVRARTDLDDDPDTDLVSMWDEIKEGAGETKVTIHKWWTEADAEGNPIGNPEIEIENDQFTANLTEVATSLGSTLGAILGQGNVGLQLVLSTALNTALKGVASVAGTAALDAVTLEEAFADALNDAFVDGQIGQTLALKAFESNKDNKKWIIVWGCMRYKNITL